MWVTADEGSTYYQVTSGPPHSRGVNLVHIKSRTGGAYRVFIWSYKMLDDSHAEITHALFHANAQFLPVAMCGTLEEAKAVGLAMYRMQD